IKPGIDVPGLASRQYSTPCTSDEAQLPTPRIATRTFRRDRESLRTEVVRDARPLRRLPFFAAIAFYTSLHSCCSARTRGRAAIRVVSSRWKALRPSRLSE